MPTLGSRIVVAGTHSGVGKTTVATGLMAALRQRGTRVAPAKVGPDFIDPGYHTLATGRPCRNLDAWIGGPETIPALAGRAAAGSDLLVVEGVMGLFDGAAQVAEGPADGTAGSTAHVARLLGAPVLLVVDGSAMSASVAALVHGYTRFDPTVNVVGVILNRVGSDNHEAMLRKALVPSGLPVLGALHRDDSLVWRHRHLGLVPVAEQPQEVRRSLDRLADEIRRRCDLDGVVRLAERAPRLTVDEPPEARFQASARIAVAGGPAFSFTYPDNLEQLRAAGAELVPFDPVADPRLPEAINGLLAGGGFPEVFAEALSANRPLLDDVRDQVTGGLVTWAECGGLLWLARSLDGRPLAGVVPGEAHMTERLTLGYRGASVLKDNPVAAAGTSLRGHEFHYSTLEPPGSALDLRGRAGSDRAGYASPSMLASYLHLHLGAVPQVAERVVATAGGRRATGA